MSEKCDTSKVVQNPLLSASVTGLTFEDFPNKPLLLPAAPLIIPTVQENTPEHTENIPSVVVGKKPDVDADTLSEINLDNNREEDVNQSENLGYSEFTNTKNLENSLLSQAASSFSQIPSVASSVFSTFSRVIKDYSPNQTTESETINQSEIVQPIPQTYETNFQGGLNLQASGSFPQPLPAAPPSVNAPGTTSTNNYRLCTKRKVYAKIPGLTTNEIKPNSDPQIQTYFNTSQPAQIISRDSTNIDSFPSTDSNSTQQSIGFSNLNLVDNPTNSSTNLILKQSYTPPLPTAPPAENIIHPPPIISSVNHKNNFRLQKGTRLYKSPLEITSVNPILHDPVNIKTATPLIGDFFNPSANHNQATNISNLFITPTPKSDIVVNTQFKNVSEELSDNIESKDISKTIQQPFQSEINLIHPLEVIKESNRTNEPYISTEKESTVDFATLIKDTEIVSNSFQPQAKETFVKQTEEAINKDPIVVPDLISPITTQTFLNKAEDISYINASSTPIPFVSTPTKTNILDKEDNKSNSQSLNLFDYFNTSSTKSDNASLKNTKTDQIEAISNNNFLKQSNSSAKNYFEKQNNNESEIVDPAVFFDSFRQPEYIEKNNISYDSNLKIQNFFNNPQDLNDSADLNYKLVGNTFTDENINKLDIFKPENGRESPFSNLVEPPSSSCSDNSAELSTSFSNYSKLDKELLKDFGIEHLNETDMASFLSGSNFSRNCYSPVGKHWFHRTRNDSKYIWTPFSHLDSAVIEEYFLSDVKPKIVAVEGGRYDVNILERTKTPNYWTADSCEVRRCSWFYKGLDSKFIPYDEKVSDLLEKEYKHATDHSEWQKKVILDNGETVMFHGPNVMVHFVQTQATDSWGTTPQNTARPRIVKRGVDDFQIDVGESSKVDHLIFMIHGIGSVCDLKFRPLEEVVDEFRSIGSQLIQAHYKNSFDSGRIGRVEVLPISWHSELHSGEKGIDKKLKSITLESIPKLRNFANETLLDVLFYTSPKFCQNIMDTVARTVNEVYLKYCQRNPDFCGKISLAGHSLGSLIVFDLLCHQKKKEENDVKNLENRNMESDLDQKEINYNVGNAGTGQPFIKYPSLVFEPQNFFALGSPIGMFVTIRGIETLGIDFKLPTCPGFYNIFHPYDPVAYRIEALISPEIGSLQPVVIPHHKGRKRMHLELKETMARVGTDLKEKILQTFKSTLDTVYQLTTKPKTDPQEIAREVDKVLERQLSLHDEPEDFYSIYSDAETDVEFSLGKLNRSRRVDYVLQEAPLEFFNEYLFALTSHVCYWDSEDTILFIMKEIYSLLNVQADSQVPQQSMTIERPTSESSYSMFAGSS